VVSQPALLMICSPTQFLLKRSKSKAFQCESVTAHACHLTAIRLYECVYVSLIAHGFVIAQLISGFATRGRVFSNPSHALSVQCASYLNIKP
jgi:hypothetical protein